MTRYVLRRVVGAVAVAVVFGLWAWVGDAVAAPAPVHIESVSPAAAAAIADEISAESRTVGVRVVIGDGDDWRYAGLFAGGSVLVMLAALVVGQLRKGG